ncbi:MAG: TrbG/VirB9 family P-type conjugative transfer protein [Acidobacteriia bacterium]|nr:TrbG/VirB9 family P-type conjugative transfer protein [Terriglobia bacterium]
MKRILSTLVCGLFTVALAAQQPQSPAQNVLHIATALNHLTVLEFHEPVTMAAAGSSDFQIERQDNKVFVKPTKPGVSTDLLVWTASRRFAYELETTEEVKTMNFAIDAAIPAAPPVVSSSADELADMMLTRAFLGAVQMHSSVRTRPNEVNIRVEQVFRTRSTVYVHYTIENDTEASYRAGLPAVFELKPEHSSISLGSIAHTQLDSRGLKKLGTAKALPLAIGHVENESEQLEPGSSAQGVVAIRQDLKGPAVLQLVFESGLKATFVM